MLFVDNTMLCRMSFQDKSLVPPWAGLTSSPPIYYQSRLICSAILLMSRTINLGSVAKHCSRCCHRYCDDF